MRAEEYRTVADQTADDLARLGYLQLAEYCEARAARAIRDGSPKPSVGENTAGPSRAIA